MRKVVVAHTGQLEPSVLAAARDLLQHVFAGELTDEDWEHCLGGVHALAYEAGSLVGHAALVQRRLLHGGRALRAGYVEGVGVRDDVRRRGHGAALMTALERLARTAYELAALGATDDGARFYRSRGWSPWAGTTWALTPHGVLRTADDDGGVHVLPLSARLDLAGSLVCDWREGDVW